MRPRCALWQRSRGRPRLRATKLQSFEDGVPDEARSRRVLRPGAAAPIHQLSDRAAISGSPIGRRHYERMAEGLVHEATPRPRSISMCPSAGRCAGTAAATRRSRRRDPIIEYLAVLRREIDLVAAAERAPAGAPYPFRRRHANHHGARRIRSPDGPVRARVHVLDGRRDRGRDRSAHAGRTMTAPSAKRASTAPAWAFRASTRSYSAPSTGYRASSRPRPPRTAARASVSGSIST